jgi:hypothetical protein
MSEYELVDRIVFLTDNNTLTWRYVSGNYDLYNKKYNIVARLTLPSPFKLYVGEIGDAIMKPIPYSYKVCSLKNAIEEQITNRIAVCNNV